MGCGTAPHFFAACRFPAGRIPCPGEGFPEEAPEYSGDHGEGENGMEIRNIGIFAHVDAGKTTLSEQLLVRAGRLRQAGSVDRGTAFTDSMEVEKRRGISVRAVCVSLRWKGTLIRLIDTPGHTDFSSEIERSFWAIDAAMIVIDAAQGVQPQTETLYAALTAQGLPVLFFLNKMDRPGADAESVLRQIRRRLTPLAVPLWDREEVLDFVCASDDALTEGYLNGVLPEDGEAERRLAELTAQGKAFPAAAGSALRGQGIEELLDAAVALLPGPDTSGADLCGVAFSAVTDPVMGRGLWVRLYGGRLENRMPVDIAAGTDRVTGRDIIIQRKIAQIRDDGGKDAGVLSAGGIGVVYGLGDTEIGHVFGNGSLLPRKVRPGLFREPLITVQVIPEKPEQMNALREACAVLSSEDPLLQSRYFPSAGELQLQVMGKVQLEIVEELLASRFRLPVRFGEPTVIYRETIRNRAHGFVAYTMPKPCWAVLEFDIAPGERGSGVTFSSVVPGKDIMPRYQHQVEQALPQALSQGRLGWQVTDVRITLTGGNHHLIHTHPLDFIVATPMGIQDGLRRGGSVLLEPILEIRFVIPDEYVGRIISDVSLMRGRVTDSVPEDGVTVLTAAVPAAESLDYPVTFASATSGRGSMSARLKGYEECPLELGRTAPRRGVDPLDTAKYILAARSALEGNIFD